MDNKEFKSGLTNVEYLVKSIHEDENDTLPDDDCSLFTFSQPEYGSVSLWNEALDRYKACVSSLYRAVNGKKSEHLSEREVERAIQDCILSSLDILENDKATPFTERLTINLQILQARLTTSPINWDIYFVVQGIALRGACFSFGGVHFLPTDRSTLRTLRRKIFPILLEGNDEKTVRRRFKNTRQIIYKHYLGNTIAHLCVKAVDKQAAEALAIKKLDLVLDVLNFYATFVHPRNIRVRAYRSGQAVFKARTTNIFFQKDEFVYFEHQITGLMDKFRVHSLNGVLGKQLGMFEASLLLNNESKPNLQERIVAALRFAGRACVNTTREEAFLGFAIALESLLGDTNSQGEITYKLSTRCAHLLGNSAEKRKEISSNIRKLYGLRSKIVHRGSIEVTDIQLHQIHTYVRYAIIEVLTNTELLSLSSEEEFLNWFEDKVLS